MFFETRDDFVRHLGALLRPLRVFPLTSTDDDGIQLFATLVHKSRCPRCNGKDWTPTAKHHVDCARCGVLSVYEGTPWHRRALNPRITLGAVHAIFVDVDTVGARRFHARSGVRLETCWDLLHEMRRALPRFRPATDGLHAQVLGFCADDNRADVVVGFGSGRLTFTDPADGIAVFGMASDRFEAQRRTHELPLWLGRLRAWLTTIFRGVRAHHLWKYLAEFADRHGRAGLSLAAAGPCIR